MHTMLEHAGETIENPADADFARVMAGPRDADWYMALHRDGDSMEVMLDSGELWVEVTEAERFVQARSRLDESVVKSMLRSFRDGDAAWRDLALWKEPERTQKQTLASLAKGPTPVILAMVALVPILVGLALFTGKGGWVAVLFALAFPGMIAAAAVTKMFEAQRVAAWTKASGRVVRSEMVTETRYDKPVQVPRIEYEFSVGFHKFVGKRVNLADTLSGESATEALARYPVGTGVTLYYNPANPSESLIDRELPAFVPGALVVAAVIAVGILVGAWWYLMR